MSITLTLFDPKISGNAALGNVTELFEPTWRRSIRRIGKFWIGTAEISRKQMERAWLDDIFTYGLLREIREQAGGEETWRGLLVKMEYQRGGDTFVQDVTRMANAIRSIYTRIGDNVLTNGSGESGAWTAYNGATVTQDATWKSHGNYSIKIQVNDTQIRGATIQSVIAVTAGKQYVIRLTLKVTSGSWRISSNRADNGQSLAFYSTGGKTGDHVVEINIPNSNGYTGNVNFQITSEAAVGIINADAGVFQEGPSRAETGWYVDDASIAGYGRKEEIFLRAGMSNAAANNECQAELLERAWPQPQPPKSARTLVKAGEDKLKFTFAGYWATLNWLYTTLHGTRGRSDWISALAGLQATYVTSGIIESNSADFFVDDRAPLRVGDLLRDVANAGGSNGEKYGVGVGVGRQLDYELIPGELSYYRRGGRLYNVAGGVIEPWLAKPGWALWQDMPIGPGSISGNAQHDPRWVFLEEVEMLPDGTVEFKLEES